MIQSQSILSKNFYFQACSITSVIYDDVKGLSKKGQQAVAKARCAFDKFWDIINGDARRELEKKVQDLEEEKKKHIAELEAECADKLEGLAKSYSDKLNLLINKVENALQQP